MFGEIFKVRSCVVSMASFLLLASVSSLTNADDGIQPKVDTILNVWLYSRGDYQAAIKLDKDEIDQLQKRVARENNDQSMKAIELLLTVNCVNYKGKRQFHILYSYLCKQGSFEKLSASAVSSLDDMYQFIFVKDQDVDRTVNFIQRYVRFWDKENSDYKSGVSPATDSKEYLLEITDYLKYRQEKKQ